MNKTRKTYGIKGFMEYQAVIKVGKGRMKVQFSGGHMNAMGIVPCTFSSENFMTQHAIENSKEFKDGLIYIVSAVDLQGNVEIEAPLHPQGEEAEAGEAPLHPQGEEAEAGEGLISVEFPSNDEAKDYLEQQFGLVRSKLRNRDDIRAAGKANGVEIIFI